ncbi:MAG: nucleotide pyrophosphatase [Verrucomicrobia bacterium 12-59-8]|nr:MAG: nucleotide pyrophosphatase [Verrucomicrobia bacterium 12-59-8]
MKDHLDLFIMIDACGWEIIKTRPQFLQSAAPHRRKLESVFGYSSTCVPSILSGRWPDEHKNWCYFIHDPENSPFAPLTWLRWLPKAFTSRRIVRRYLTKLVKHFLGFKGYFDLYNIPFQQIHLYDFTEKKSPLKPCGMNRGENIFDQLEARNVPYFVTNPDLSEESNRDRLNADIAAQRITFAFQYWAGLDGLLHRVGNQSPTIDTKLAEYETWITQTLKLAHQHYSNVSLHVFSDHGMANCDVHLDLVKEIEALGLRIGTDYNVVYDSTMARYWFFNEDARRLITDTLKTVIEGRIVPDDELKSMRAYFEDGRFGELIFLVREGTLIVPSHMGERPIRAMHGYHPHDPQSYATLFSSTPDVPADITHIPHIHRLMTQAVAPAAAITHQHALAA